MLNNSFGSAKCINGFLSKLGTWLLSGLQGSLRYLAVIEQLSCSWNSSPLTCLMQMTVLHSTPCRSYWTLCAHEIDLFHRSLLQAAAINFFSRQQGSSCFSIATESLSALSPPGPNTFLLVWVSLPWKSDQPWTNLSSCPKQGQGKPCCPLPAPWAHASGELGFPSSFDSLASAQVCQRVATGCNSCFQMRSDKGVSRLYQGWT